MTGPSELYRPSLALLTDLYELTMAYAYFKNGVHEKQSCFHLFFRSHPFRGGFTVAAGLAYAIDFLKHFRFRDDDLTYMAGLRGSDDKPLFSDDFLEYLRDLRLECEIDAIPEGTVVFPFEPLVRTRGSLLHCQLLETPLLNLINFQTLIATKAARICTAAGGDPVLEFGLRRAQGVDGGLSEARAAYIGGCAATSNVLAGKLFGIPVRGTHAHSWVMSFASELESFEAWADAMPNNSIFLVDTYDSLDGVRRAIQVGHRLRERGYDLAGIRLDSGDLAYLSIEARKMLDQAGFENARIVGSNDLDEHIISSLKQQGATICVWGVGTKLATAFDEPALGGVYKLSAIREPGGAWDYRIKLSEQTAKISTPGILQVRRFHDAQRFIADMIFDEQHPPNDRTRIVDPVDPARQKSIAADAEFEDLLVPIFRGGKCVYEGPPLKDIRTRTLRQLEQLDPAIKRFINPHRYPAGLASNLYEAKMRLIDQVRNSLGK